MIFEIGSESINALKRTSFDAAGLRERNDLQRLLRDRIDVVAPDVLIISEEFGEWSDSRRRIDLLGIDKEANLVVIELKRTEDGGHMELQAIRYAAMVSALTAEKAVEIFASYLELRGREDDPEQVLLEFLGWDQLDEDRFAQDVRIVLVSADFSKELTTAVMWLNEKDMDVRCVRMQPYAHDGRTFIDVQQVIPLPEAEDFQVRVREKKRQERRSRTSGVDFTRFDITLDGRLFPNQWKRNAVLLVVKHLCDKGVSPAEVAQAMGMKESRLWRWTEGTIEDPEAFNAKVSAEQPGYEERRWHTREGDLITHGGRTYALTNQWGRRWAEGLDRLKESHLSITPRFQFGPDVFDLNAGIWWDVTTARQWGVHVGKYEGLFGTGVPLLYGGP